VVVGRGAVLLGPYAMYGGGRRVIHEIVLSWFPHGTRAGDGVDCPDMSKAWKVFLWVVATVVALLAVIRVVGSPIATSLMNRKLAAMPQFAGHVDAVQLALWRGTVSVRNLQLTDRAHAGDGPVVTVPQSQLSFAWAPLFRGRLGGDLAAERVQVVMVKRAETVKDETEKAKKLAKPLVRGWQEVLAKQFPIELRKMELKDGTVRFEDRSDPQPVGLTIDQIQLTATGFSNREKSDEALPARVTMTGRMGGRGRIEMDARADPAERLPRFEVRFEAKGIELVPLHDFLARYALIDVSSGEFELYSEVTAANGAYDGYTKPFFKNLDFKAVPDPEKSIMQRAATKVASAMKNALKNEQGEVATKAPFHGNFEDNQVEVWTTLENLLRNAFIQALREGLEGQGTGDKS